MLVLASSPPTYLLPHASEISWRFAALVVPLKNTPTTSSYTVQPSRTCATNIQGRSSPTHPTPSVGLPYLIISAPISTTLSPVFSKMMFVGRWAPSSSTWGFYFPYYPNLPVLLSIHRLSSSSHPCCTLLPLFFHSACYTHLGYGSPATRFDQISLVLWSGRWFT